MNFENIFGTSKGKKDPLDNMFMLPSGSKTNKTIVNPNVISMFKGQGHPRPDQKTKQQTAFLKRTAIGTGRSHERFVDLDGDGVINGLDCKYKNPMRHSSNYNETSYPVDRKKKGEWTDYTPEQAKVHARIHGLAGKNYLEISDDESEELRR